MAPGGLDFSDSEDLFILTFSGESGKSVNLKLNDLSQTYCTVDGEDRLAETNSKITVSASAKANEGKNAAVRLTMDKVTDFTGKGDPGITVTITGNKTGGSTIYTELDNSLHRESTSIPSFLLENTVLADDTYTVEVSGIGYVSYKKENVSFDDVLEITNADFIPGDVNADGKIDKDDKTAVEELIANNEYSEAADFNRDGKVNKYDLDVFAGITVDGSVPAKLNKPKLTASDKKISVSWEKSADETVTGYVIKYSSDSKNEKTVNVNGINKTSYDLTVFRQIQHTV